MPAILMMLVIPLGFWMIGIFNWTSHLASRQLEQIRLDAVTLSLCHQRKNFLEQDILAFNSEIKAIQIAMDAEAQACMSSGTAAPVVCSGVLVALRAESLAAKSIQSLQDIRRGAYPLQAKNSFETLKTKNELRGRFDSKIYPATFAPLSDGLEREMLNPAQLTYQTFCGCEWPRILNKDINFESKNKIEIRFYPQRTMARELKKTTKVTVKSGPAVSASGCSVNQSLSVERIL